MINGLISTTGDLITFALRASGINGIGQTPNAEDSFTGLQFLVSMLAQWQKRRWLVLVEQEVSLTSTGAQSYTIGPGMDFNCPRPDHITAAYVRILNATPPNLVDVPVQILYSREEYSAISVKTIQTFPVAVWYESAFPTGNVYWWPVPPSGMYGLYLVVKAPLPTFTTLVDPINLPPEYMEALIWSLCVRMQMAYGLPARPDHVMAMNEAMATLRAANMQLPELITPTFGRRRGDASLVGHGLGRAFILDDGPVLG